jgi:hypothetical protein
MSGSYAACCGHRLLDVAEELQVAQALLASSVSDLDHQIAGVINTCEGVFECLICRSDISMQVGGWK